MSDKRCTECGNIVDAINIISFKDCGHCTNCCTDYRNNVPYNSKIYRRVKIK